MKPYPFYQSLDLIKITEEVLAQWKRHDTFLQSIRQRKNAPEFTFYEGPPSANGSPGIHHVLARTLKDLFCRYKTMQGYKVERRGGWDTHGLPVELQVEKELGITKEDIGKKISIEAYNKCCRQTVMSYQKQWEDLTEKIGYWIDLKNSYKTCDRDYILALWGVLKKLHKKKLLYKGHSVQPYSPAAGTGLSTHELNQPGCYKMVKETSVVAQFQLKKTPNTYLLAWTTTPWTLPANSALAINQQAIYIKVRTYNPFTRLPIDVILAEKCLPNYFAPSMQNATMQPSSIFEASMPWKVVDRYQGSNMVGWEYNQLLPYIEPSKPAFRIVHADFATLEGTGVIHIAPTFGKDDYHLAQQKEIPPITIQNKKGEEMPIVDRQGRFVKEIIDFAGCYVKEAYAPEAMCKAPDYLPTDIRIVTKLKKENKAFRVATYTHSYPHCWRTDKPIIYYPLSAWFIKTTACKARLIKLNKTINWHPQSTGKGRFGEWLENIVDWNLSRSRFWGTPLPIWRTKDNKEEKCIGSLEELAQEVNKAIKGGVVQNPLHDDIDLHKPYVDDIILLSTKGKKMYRESDLVDVWFDAGSMPYVQENFSLLNEKGLPSNFPAHFIAEGIDQTRGWFFTLHLLAVMLFDHIAFKNVLVTGLLLDKNGIKMSKRLGNTLNPLDLLTTYGPDIIRWYMMVHAHPWDNLKFDINGLKEVRNKFFSTLYNTYQFFVLYANLDQFVADNTYPPQHHCKTIDLWILSKLQLLITSVIDQYNAYNPTKATRSIQTFVIDDLSNWYIRLNRKRFWRNGMNLDKHNAYRTLYTCLCTVAQLSAPVAPFYMERLYQDLHPNTAYTSIHLKCFPQVEKQYRNTALEEQMRYAQTITSLVHGLRKKHGIKVRQPLSSLFIIAKNQAQIQKLKSLILAETNIKEIIYVDDTSHMTSLQIKPNFKELGAKYGSRLPEITKALAKLKQNEIKAFKQKGFHTLYINQKPLDLTDKQVIITTKNTPGWGVAQYKNITLALDLNLTPALRYEGLARELVNRLQNLRKSYGMAVDQKIHLYLATTDTDLQTTLTTHKNYLMKETQALKLKLIFEKKLTDGTILMLGKKELYSILIPVHG